MTQTIERIAGSITYEENADEALLQGDICLAESILREGIAATYLSDPETYHHLAIKAISLPYYDMLTNGENEERRSEADNVWGWTGDLIQRQLEELNDGLLRQSIEARREVKSGSEEDVGKHFGRLSELLIFGLLARDLDHSNGWVPLISSRQVDREGIDISIYPVVETEGLPLHIQVKTKIKEEDRDRYAGDPTFLIGLDQIDQLYTRPYDPRSLASRFVSELQGTASARDIRGLDHATKRMYEIFQDQQAVDLS